MTLYVYLFIVTFHFMVHLCLFGASFHKMLKIVCLHYVKNKNINVCYHIMNTLILRYLANLIITIFPTVMF